MDDDKPENWHCKDCATKKSKSEGKKNIYKFMGCNFDGRLLDITNSYFQAKVHAELKYYFSIFYYNLIIQTVADGG